MSKEEPLQHNHLQVTTDLEETEVVLQWFEQISKPLLPEQLYWRCLIVLIEGFTNAVRHGNYHLPSDTTIDLEINWFSDSLEMLIWDWGKPFDLKAKLESVMERQSLDCEHGRGLFFIKKLTDEVDYIRTDSQRNCLIMRKKLNFKATHESSFTKN